MIERLTHERLLELLDYDPKEGSFRWRVRRGGVRAGTLAGGDHGTGYKVIGIDRRLYLEHRLAWFYVHGSWPSDQIDHINGVKNDNRIVNLREATTSQNHQNMPVMSRNRSGFTGVHRCKMTGKWCAMICVAGERYNLGRFDTAALAHEAYVNAKAEKHKFNPSTRRDKTRDEYRLHQREGLRAVALKLREAMML